MTSCASVPGIENPQPEKMKTDQTSEHDLVMETTPTLLDVEVDDPTAITIEPWSTATAADWTVEHHGPTSKRNAGSKTGQSN